MVAPVPPILDPHVHLLDPARFGYPWIPAGSELDALVAPGDYLTSARPGTRAIVVEAGAAVGQAQAEAEAARDAAASHEWIRGFVAALHPDADVAEQDQLDRLGGIGSLLVGLRVDLTKSRVRAALGRRGHRLGAGLSSGRGRPLPIDLLLPSDDPGVAVPVCAANPGAVFVVDHLASPPGLAPAGVAPGALGPAALDAEEAWRAALRRLAALPNTVLKVSGPTARLAAGGEVERDRLRASLDAFGPARLLFASDFPVSITVAGDVTVADWAERVRAGLTLSPSELAAVCAGNAERVYLS